MTSAIAMSRVKQALEKQDTQFNLNLNLHDYEDAFNKALNDWIRRQIHGGNPYKEGSEESTMRVDDLQILLMEKSLHTKNSSLFADTDDIPENYRYYNRLSVHSSKGDCSGIIIPSMFIESGNVNEYLSNWNMSPSFDFEQCFHIMLNNKFRVYHGGDFKIDKVMLTYYRNPLKIKTDKFSWDEPWEWKEDVAELIIDEAVKYLAGNIEHPNAYQLANNRVEQNN